MGLPLATHIALRGRGVKAKEGDLETHEGDLPVGGLSLTRGCRAQATPCGSRTPTV
jgi:hypothetical protein